MHSIRAVSSCNANAHRHIPRGGNRRVARYAMFRAPRLKIDETASQERESANRYSEEKEFARPPNFRGYRALREYTSRIRTRIDIVANGGRLAAIAPYRDARESLGRKCTGCFYTNKITRGRHNPFLSSEHRRNHILSFWRSFRRRMYRTYV